MTALQVLQVLLTLRARAGSLFGKTADSNASEGDRLDEKRSRLGLDDGAALMNVFFPFFFATLYLCTCVVYSGVSTSSE